MSILHDCMILHLKFRLCFMNYKCVLRVTTVFYTAQTGLPYFDRAAVTAIESW